MGLLDFLKKKPKKEKVMITTHEYTGEKLRAQQIRSEQERGRNFQKDSAGLYPYEILMLSYLEKYTAGKEHDQFWKHEYGVDDVSALIKSLEDRGFSRDGKLTEIGQKEIKNNEYVFYMHKHKFHEISMSDMCILVNKNPGRPYRDLLWAEFNRLSGKYMESMNIGLYRNVRYTMYKFLCEEKRYKSAFCILAEVLFYDLNGDKSPFIAPRVVKNFQELEQKTDYSEDELSKEVFRSLEGIYAPYNNFSVSDISEIIIAYSFGNVDIAESIFEKGKNSIKNEPIVFKSTLTGKQRKKANIRVE